MELKKLLENLKQPLEYKYKIQSVPKEKKWQPWVFSKGNCVAYIDSRDCQDILDAYCEEWWQNEFYEVKGKVFCRVGIKINWEWFWRSDSWSLEDNNNVAHDVTSKWETSDAFKRACVQWWIWRFLYEKPPIWIDIDTYNANKYKIDEWCKKQEKWVKKEVSKIDDIIAEMYWVKSMESLKKLFLEWMKLNPDSTELKRLETVKDQMKSKFI